MSLLILAMAGSLAAASTPPATANTVSGVAVSAAAPAKTVDDPGKIVCHTEEITGSRFTQHVCKTKAEWVREEDAAANYKREVDDRQGLQGKPTGPFGN